MADSQEWSEHNSHAQSEQLTSSLGGAQRGQMLGPYWLVERLGGGAMATVYRAVDKRTGRGTAVKVLRPDADTVMRERFRREAETHSNLNHPNIVRILDIGHAPDSGLTYIAMELIDGPNLSEVIESASRLSPADTARILAPIATALDYSCHQGVIHRDVKPSNVLLRRVHEGTRDAVAIAELDTPVYPLLSDFGIARALDAPDLTSAGRTIGTPTYMSPEQCADSHEIDGRSDLYSLGAVFYRCVVGRPPFGGTTTQILHAHVYDPLTIPDNVLAELPPLAITLLRRSLAKDPDLRYSDGAAMAADLQALAGRGPHTEAAVRQGEVTETMPVLPVAQPSLPLGGQTVLVPGPEAMTVATGEPPVPAFIPIELPLARPVTPVAPPVVRPRRRWIGAVLGGVLAAVVLIFGGGLALNLLPDDLVRPRPDATAVVVPVVSPAASQTQAPVANATPTAPEVAVVTAEMPSGIDTAADGTSTARPAPSIAAGIGEGGTPPAATPSRTAATAPLPTPAGDIRAFWAEAEAAYQDGDWQNALEFLTLVRRIDPAYQGDTGDQILFESRVALAASAIATGDLEKALEHLDAAVTLRPDVSRVAGMRTALQALLAPGTLNIAMARWTLATALGSYARDLLNGENPCAAADQLQAAVALSPQASSAQVLAEAQAACEKARRDAGVRRELAQLRGRLLYSTQEGSAYRIYRAPALLNAQSVLLVDNAAQPARQKSSAVVALHNTGSAAPGIALFDLSAGLAPNERTLQLTSGAGDARDAPVSWAPGDQTVVFGSTAADSGRTRVYRKDLASPAGAVDLGLGRDPAWSPDQDRIVYNGVNEQGNEPGLWLMNGDGSNRQRLTDNGNDIRPVWAPDGLSVIFMSQRDGDWEVYRLDLLTAQLLKLTDDPAQDGLPTVSPDGRWVAFASDRGGFWRIWVVPIEGGAAQPLVKVNGVLTNWLEHAIQWIP